jgi:excisionase family DNA binding protein
MAVRPGDGSGLVDVAGAAAYLGVTEGFVRRLVLERRVRYFKLGKFVRFRTVDLNAFVEAGRHEPIPPWVHPRSTPQRARRRSAAQQPSPSRLAARASEPHRKGPER